MLLLNEALLAACLTNPDFKQTSACQTLSKAIYFQPTAFDRKLDEISASIPPYIRHLYLLTEAVNNGRIYIPIVNKEF